ncbi:MAG: TIGR00730 family Rossman fold protein [Bacteriovoracaceae bacterium]|mgnify:CR=1 FL=1|jgi:uncharacterized protein (TIGR00730 family)|nr:TIGR00730 family Rossman fold protein [Bacteriovoracaceae bacterium]
MKKSLCVFCGSSQGTDKIFCEQASALGKHLATSNIKLIYGGASIGCMGAIANGCLRAGGEVEGIIPEHISDLEVAHDGLDVLHVTDNMHQRKDKMYCMSDAFLALSGGFGTLDELCEVVTWKQLGLHNKPIFLVNTNGFYDHFLEHIKSVSKLGFMKPIHLEYVEVVSCADEAIERLNQYFSPRS